MFIRFRSICSTIKQNVNRSPDVNRDFPSPVALSYTTLSNFFLFSFSSSQEAIAYFPLVILISGAFASVIVKKISKSLGTKVN